MEGSIVADSVRDQGDDRDVFECNICMDRPKNSVLTSCGHLFCWSCLYGWLENQVKPCPSCKLMLGRGSIVPVYGCQKESSTVVDGSIPPRPSAPLSASNAALQGNGTAADPADMAQDHDLESLRERALANLRAMRQSYPPSAVPWIAEASNSFDPSVNFIENVLRGPDFDHQVFTWEVLYPQGECIPGMYEFRMSWLPYYFARHVGLSVPSLFMQELYEEFVRAWIMHFHEAWDRAGRPEGEELFVEVAVGSLAEPAEPRVSSGDDSSSASVDSREVEVVWNN